MSSGKGVEAREGVGDSAVTMLHVDDDVVVTGKASNLSESRGEAEEKEAVECFSIVETGFEGAGRRR